MQQRGSRSRPAVLLVANVTAGSADEQRLAAVHRTLAQERAVEQVTCADRSELIGHLRRLGDRLLVVAGGDGTLHQVVALLADLGTLASTDLGLVPLGTGNDFARSLGIELDPVEAARTCLRGEPLALDLIERGDGALVINAAHAGLGARAAAAAARYKSVLGPVAYPVGVLQVGLRTACTDVVVRVDDGTLWAGPTILVAIGNGPLVGSGTPLLARADPSDGLLDVTVITCVQGWRRAPLALDVLRGRHLDRGDVLTRRGATVHIDGQALPYDVDGELQEPAAEATFRVRPLAWRLMVPAGRRRTGEGGR